MRATVVAVCATFVLAATGCGGNGGSRATSTDPQHKITDLNSVSQLRAAFNTASGEPRLVVLVSPT